MQTRVMLHLPQAGLNVVKLHHSTLLTESIQRLLTDLWGLTEPADVFLVTIPDLSCEKTKMVLNVPLERISHKDQIVGSLPQHLTKLEQDETMICFVWNEIIGRPRTWIYEVK